jgi:hypothetical protein
VETPEQERFVDSLPVVLDAATTARHPDLARAVAAERLVDAAAAAAAGRPPAAPGRPPTPELLAGYTAAFALIDADASGALDAGEVAALFRRVGAEAPPGEPAAFLAREPGGALSPARFEQILSAAARAAGPPPPPPCPTAEGGAGAGAGAEGSAAAAGAGEGVVD